MTAQRDVLTSRTSLAVTEFCDVSLKIYIKQTLLSRLFQLPAPCSYFPYPVFVTPNCSAQLYECFLFRMRSSCCLLKLFATAQGAGVVRRSFTSRLGYACVRGGASATNDKLRSSNPLTITDVRSSGPCFLFIPSGRLPHRITVRAQLHIDSINQPKCPVD